MEQPANRTIDYLYDELDRLVEEKITASDGSVRTISYTYDPVGNRLTKNDNGVITTYTYDDNDRLQTEGGFTYTYDNNGNMLTKSGNGEQVNLTYNYLNQLVHEEMTTTTSSTTVDYLYDHDGIRIRKTLNGTDVTNYIVDKNRPYAQVLEERDSTGSLLTRYLYGHDLLAQTRGTATHYYYYDGLSSPRLLSDMSGSITDTYSYDAYGLLLASTGSTSNPYLYRGEQYDPELNAYYLRARYYQPGIGRFTTVDPFEGFTREPISLHRYLYGNGDPVNYLDPSGESSLTDLLAATTIIGILVGLQGDTARVVVNRHTREAGDCGPDVTFQLDNTIMNIRNTFDSWEIPDKRRACQNVYLPAFFGGTGLAWVWDIPVLKRIGAGDVHIPDIRGCSICQAGTLPDCKKTVSYHKKCYSAAALNFIMWGIINQI